MRQLRTVEEQAQSLANCLPGGRVFAPKNRGDSNLRAFIRGLAGELFRADSYIRLFEQEIIPDATVLFIDEWEQAVGIPDACFTGTGDLATRRRDVLIKLGALGVQTADDFVELASLFGVVVTVSSGSTPGGFPMTFPILLLGPAAYYTIIVQFTVTAANRFPMTFPITFGDSDIATIECLFTQLKPANCQLIFEQV